MAGNPNQPTGAGRVLGGRYRLVSPIARGGMAEVWEGHDVVLTRAVAIKVLQAHLAADSVFLERFRREAVTAARLSHPGIVSTFDTGLDRGTAYIVMELVRGRNLRQYMSDLGPLPAWQAVTIARQVADALAYSHQAGLVHRDIKPANILLVEDEWGGTRVKVTDFGIAKAGEKVGGDLTRTGVVLGTPKYLSPEQIRGEDPDARADLYSLGVVLFEMLTGTPPYVGETDMATALAHLNDKVPKVSSRVAGIPPGLDRLVSDLLAKDPDKRVASAIIVRQRLDALGSLSASSSRSSGGTKGSLVTRGSGWGWVRGAAGGQRTPAGDARGSSRRPPTPTGYPFGFDPVVSPASPPPGTGGVPAAAAAQANAQALQNGSAGAPPTGGAPVAPLNAPATNGPTANGPAANGSGANGSWANGSGAIPVSGNGGGVPSGHNPSSASAAVTQAAAGVAASAGAMVAPGPLQPNTRTASNGAAADATVADRASAPSHADPRTSDPEDPGDRKKPKRSRAGDSPPSPRRNRRGERVIGGVVAGLVLAGAILVGILFASQSGAGHHAGASQGPFKQIPVSNVSVFMANSRQPDDPAGTRLVIDGNPSTYWKTDPYATAQFGNLYPGIGLDISLSSREDLHQLTVTSPTVGWTAQTYVTDGSVPSGQSVTAWGTATDTKTSTSTSTTFDLKGQKGRHILLWLKNLGPSRATQVGGAYRYYAQISEVEVS